MAAHISISKQLHYAKEGEMGGVDVREPSTAIFAVSSVDRYQTPNNQTLSGVNANGSMITPQSMLSAPSNEFSLSTVNPLYPIGVAQPSSPYDFTINSNQNLLAGFFTRIAVSEIIFRYTLPTLTSRNNKIYIVWAPGGRSATTAVTGTSTALVTFTMASTTGYSSGQTIVIGNQAPVTVGGITYQVNGIYTISTVTGTTLLCNNPNGLPTFSIVTQAGTVGIRYLLTINEGWYDLTNTTSGDGNLAYQVQTAVRNATGDAAFTLVYNQLTASTTAGPYNAFNALSNSTDTFWWLRYTDATAPNRVGLNEMMSWESTQTYATYQYGDPNVSLLSTPFVDITCDQLTYNQGVKDADTGVSHNILCRVYIVPDAFTGNMANLGSGPILVHRCYPFPKQIRWRGNQNIGGGLRFQVWDSQGYLLTTNEGVTGATALGSASLTYYDADMGDWTITMLASEV